MIRSRAFLFLLLFLSGEANAADLQIKEIKYDCKAYNEDRFTLKIRSDGKVTYIGKHHAAALGWRTSRISQEEFRKLVTKIQKIDFFGMEDRYANYLLDEPATSDGVSAEVTRTVFTDQQPKLITVVTGNGRKTVEDYMGPPKGLYELEELILEITNASRWSGDREDWHDIPFYEHLPKNKQVTLRALLQPYYTDTGSGRVNGYNLALIKNTPVSFEVVAPRKSDLAKLEKYIIDATGYIKKGATLEHEFVLKSIKPVRRYRN